MNHILSISEWATRREQHRRRAQGWTHPRAQRKALGQREPVLDFLFEYYPYSPTKIEQWFPGVGVDLEVDDSHFLDHGAFRIDDGIQSLDPTSLDKHRRRLDFVLDLLNGIETRPATLNCFGMHEWAMVYRSPAEDIRHPDPLRLSPQQVEETVDHIGLRCTHIDAFRFFTPEAAPKNVNSAGLIPTRDNQPELDQKGCLHANMDLYKYCMWFQPWVPGELLLDCFDLALTTRRLDMQASPYDLSEFGYEPIPVETPEGRARYAAEQRRISELADPLREQLTQALTTARDAALATSP